jgi:hypothetical protein
VAPVVQAHAPASALPVIAAGQPNTQSIEQMATQIVLLNDICQRAMSASKSTLPAARTRKRKEPTALTKEPIALTASATELNNNVFTTTTGNNKRSRTRNSHYPVSKKVIQRSHLPKLVRNQNKYSSVHYLCASICEISFYRT